MLASASPLDQLARNPTLRREFLRRLGNVLIVGSTTGFALIYAPFLAAFARPWFTTTDTTSQWRVVSIRQPATIAGAPLNRSVTLPDQPMLVIPKLAISAPIIVDVDGANQYTYNTALKSGVAQMKGTAAVDALDGNTFIFGHSSRFAVSGTPYDTIFAALSTMDEGDEVQLATPTGIQQFSVISSRSTGPNDTSVLEPTDQRTVTIETCWPLGTTAKRWVVQAQAI